MTRRSIAIFGWLSAVSICLSPHQLLAETKKVAVTNTPTTYEDDKIKVVIQDCSRKLQDTICQVTLTSKNGERAIFLNGNNIRLVDMEGNEYRPSSLKLANLVSENNSVGTELVESVPVKASFVFGKIPTNTTKFALLQIPLGGGLTGIAKFRSITVVDPNAAKPTKIAVTTPVKTTATSPPKTTTTTTTTSTPKTPIGITRTEPSSSNELSLVCPDNTKILYRAVSKSYLMYICGGKNPTHYVGLAKDGSQGITLRLRYYDRTQFSADNGVTNYTIANNKLIISKNTKVVYQEKIQVLQSLPGVATAEETPPKKTKKIVTVEEPKPKERLKKATPEVSTSTIKKSPPANGVKKIRRRLPTTTTPDPKL
jgi:hypothetical protein